MYNFKNGGMSKMIRTTTIMKSNNSHISIFPKPILDLMGLTKGDKISWEYNTKTEELKINPIEKAPD